MINLFYVYADGRHESTSGCLYVCFPDALIFLSRHVTFHILIMCVILYASSGTAIDYLFMHTALETSSGTAIQY